MLPAIAVNGSTAGDPGPGTISPGQERRECRNYTRVTSPGRHPARTVRRLLGGKNHCAGTRETAETVSPPRRPRWGTARRDPRFLGRAVRYMVSGGRHPAVLAIEPGCPPRNNGAVAQAVEPSPPGGVRRQTTPPLVAKHARAAAYLLRRGQYRYIHADLRDQAATWRRPRDDVLDFSHAVEPATTSLSCIHPRRVQHAAALATLVDDACSPRSYLTAAHGG